MMFQSITLWNFNTTMIKAIIFDFDGTLVDTAPDLIASANYVFKQHKQLEISYQEGLACSSDGTLAFLLKRFSKEEIDSQGLVNEFIEYYLTVCADNVSLFSDLEILLKNLYQQNIILGIVTNKPKIFTNKIIERLDIHHLFKFVISPDDGFKPKPDNDMLLNALTQENLKPTEVLYIGDGERDIIAANKTNVGSVLAAYGYIDPKENVEVWGNDYVINSSKDLKLLIDSFSL